MNITRRYPTCDTCGDIFVFDMNGPFASCNCGPTEWSSSQRPTNPIYATVRESDLKEVFTSSQED